MIIDYLISYEDIFEQKRDDLKSYLSGISRSKLMLIATSFLALNNRNSKFEDFGHLLSTFFRTENAKFANDVFLKLKKIKEEKKAEPIIITPVTMLKLFEFTFDNLLEQDIQIDEEAERNIFKAILCINSDINQDQRLSGDTTENALEGIKFAALSIAQSYPYTELINYELSEVLGVQMLKAYYLFEFLELHPKTKELLEEFLKFFNVKTWQQFFQNLYPLVFAVFKNKNEGHIDIVIQKDDKFQASCTFIEKLIISDDELLIDYDYRKIRSKPFYKVTEGIYRIISKLFLVELVYKGIYFKIAEIYKKVKENDVKENFRSFYGLEFSERFLLYKLLNSIYKNKYVEYSGEQISKIKPKIEAEPDYYLRNGNNLFLLESKDVLINAQIKQSYNYHLYETEFKSRFYYVEKDGKKSNKAILQLINNVERSLTRSFSFDSNYKTTSIRIYPILVLHDRQFNVAGLNVLLNYWFQEALQSLKDKNLNIDKVKPLTVIDIDSLLFQQDLLRDRSIRLNEIIDAYHQFIKINPKKIKSEQVLKNSFYQSVTPFSIFISNYVNDRKIRRVPKSILEKSYPLVNKFD